MLYIVVHLDVSNVLVSKNNEGYLVRCKLGNMPYNAHIFRGLNTCLISGHLQQFEKDNKKPTFHCRKLKRRSKKDNA